VTNEELDQLLALGVERPRALTERERLNPPGRKFTEGELRRGLSRERKVELLSMFVDLGYPAPLQKRPGTRGPKFRGSQYTKALARRRDLWRRLVENPRRRIGSGHIDHELIRWIGNSLLARMTPKHDLVQLVQREYARKYGFFPDASTIRRSLKRSS
jgi:hypothetical protein